MSSVYEQLHAKIDELPQSLAGEVLDFLDFLRHRQMSKLPPSNEAPPVPYDSWLSYRMDNPYAVEEDWKPLSRDEAHDRQLR